MNYSPRAMRQTICTLLLTFLLISGIESGSALAGGQVSMMAMERKIERQFKDVANMTPEQFEILRSERPDDIVLLDVREANEFAISHLPEAVRVDPGISQAAFVKAFAGDMKDKTVVLYCSVGYRSSRLVARVQDSLTKLGVKGVYNLRGGIFAWHNAGRIVVRDRAETNHIHPYNKTWSRYLEFDHHARYGNQRSWWQW